MSGEFRVANLAVITGIALWGILIGEFFIVIGKKFGISEMGSTTSEQKDRTEKSNKPDFKLEEIFFINLNPGVQKRSFGLIG